VKAYPAETTEAFLDGHVSAFAFFGGVPLSILYDNTKLAVARILGDGQRTRTRAFTELVSHFPPRGHARPSVRPHAGLEQRQALGLPNPNARTRGAFSTVTSPPNNCHSMSPYCHSMSPASQELSLERDLSLAPRSVTRVARSVTAAHRSSNPLLAVTGSAPRGDVVRALSIGVLLAQRGQLGSIALAPGHRARPAAVQRREHRRLG
jgi:hypothetical protein